MVRSSAGTPGPGVLDDHQDALAVARGLHPDARLGGARREDACIVHECLEGVGEGRAVGVGLDGTRHLDRDDRRIGPERLANVCDRELDERRDVEPPRIERPGLAVTEEVVEEDARAIDLRAYVGDLRRIRAALLEQLGPGRR